VNLLATGFGATLVAGILLLGSGPIAFRGCDSDEPPEAPLPLVDAGGCTTDAECVDACRDSRCVSGVCVTVGPVVDGDGDGHAPRPCGDDCDDSNPAVFGGATEQCDGQDNDCDGTIDEDAPRLDATYTIAATGGANAVVVRWDDRFMVTQVTSSAIFGLPVELDGTVGVPVEIMRLSMGSRFETMAAASNGSETLFLAVTDLGAVLYVILEPAEGLPRRIEGPATMDTPSDIKTVEVMPFLEGWAIGYDATTTSGPRRLVTTDPMVAPTIAVPISSAGAGETSFGLATDGTHLVVSDDVGNVHFFLPNGTAVATHHVEGLSARRALASWDAAVVTAVPDAFDVNLAFVRVDSGVGTTLPAPSGEPGDQLWLSSIGGFALVSRSGSFGASVQALRGDLSTFEGSPFLVGRTGARQTRFTVAETPSAIGFLASFSDDNVSLGLLKGCAVD